MDVLDLGNDAIILDTEAASAGGPLASKASALSNRIAGVLATSYVDVEFREVLAQLDTDHVQNTAAVRRQLPTLAQKEVIDWNGEVVRSFGRVAEQLRCIGGTITSLQRCLDDMRQQVAVANRETAPVVEESSSLFAQKGEIETKQLLLQAFREHFLLSDEELTHLTSLQAGVDDRFFQLLSRLKGIHRDCQILLGFENQQLGLELMEQSSRQLESAYQKLIKWIQKEFKTLDLENPRMHFSIRRALRILAERPALFQDCLDFFAEARERNLSDAFYAALIGSDQDEVGPGAKAMEYYAHDPLRFVGDMLAWTHSAAVSERESLEVLFISEGDEMAHGLRIGVESEPWTQDGPAVFDGHKSLAELVARNLAGVCKALRSRIEQVIRGDDDAVLAYKIANLIDFYRITFLRMLGSESSVLATFRDMHELALQQYRNAMSETVNAVPASEAAPADMAPPEFMIDALNRLRQLIASFESSFTPMESRATTFGTILQEALEPFLEICLRMAQSLEQPSMSIFLINCLQAVQQTLASCEDATDKRAGLEKTIDEHFSRLIEFQHAFFLHTSGLHPLFVAFAELTDSEEDLKAAMALDILQPQNLADASQILDDFLPSALMDAKENLRYMRSLQMAEDITNEAAARFCEDFDFVDARMSAADSLMASTSPTQESIDGRERRLLKSLYPRTSGEIRVLLS